MHPNLSFNLEHQVIRHEAEPFDEAAGVRGSHRFDLRFAVMLEIRALIRQQYIGDEQTTDVAGQWNRHQQVRFGVGGVVGDDDSRMRLTRFTLAPIRAKTNKPNITAPDQCHCALSSSSNPSVLSTGYAISLRCWAAPRASYPRCNSSSCSA